MSAIDDVVKAAREVLAKGPLRGEHERVAMTALRDAMAVLDNKIKRHRWGYVNNTTEQRCFDCGAGFQNGRYRTGANAPWQKMTAPPCAPQAKP